MIRPRGSGILLGGLFGLAFWVFDAVVDFMHFPSSFRSFWDALLWAVPHQSLVLRLTIFAGFLVLAGILSIHRRRHLQLIEELSESRHRFHTLFEDSPLPTWEDDWSEVKAHIEALRVSGVTDLEAYLDDHPDEVDHCISKVRVVDANRAAVRLHEASNKQALIDRFFETLPQDTRSTYRDELLALARGETEFRAETVHVTHSGCVIDVELTVQVAQGHEVDLKRVFISTLPITERKEAERKLYLLARHDSLTGAYNRHTLRELLVQEEERARRYGHPVGLIMVDVNRFKEINDRFGHQMGDRILQSVAGLLMDEVRTTDFVVRYGGDEFLIVLPETNGETETVRARIQKAVSRRNQTNEMVDFPVTLAVGTAHWDPQTGRTIEELLGEADARMYEDKRSCVSGGMSAGA